MSLEIALNDTESTPAADHLLSRIDRAAVFLMLLGDDEASGILGRLAPAELEKLERKDPLKKFSEKVAV